MRTIDDVLKTLPSPIIERLAAPSYCGPVEDHRSKVVLGVESMARHTTDEGAQLQWGLEAAGYQLFGHGFPACSTHVPWIISIAKPGTVMVQDAREWEGLTAGGGGDPRMRFQEVEVLKHRPDVFKVTVLKDAQHRPEYHRQSAEEIGCHAWIVYYHPRVVAHLAPYVRTEHLIRTWHTIDPALVPPGLPDRPLGCLLSGALSKAYPLRTRLAERHKDVPGCDLLPHPGYRRDGCHTPGFLKRLSRYRVAICTSSIYGYSLRKLIEATACGCRVITDLPADDVLPGIDGNLVRVGSDATVEAVADAARECLANWSFERQEYYAAITRAAYDFRVVGRRLADDVEALRRVYGADAVR